MLDEGHSYCSIRTICQLLEQREESRERRNPLTVHADRGSAMIPNSVAFLMADLGVTKTHSCPSVCDDNPYSESQFRTLKYRPDFSDRFGSIQDARAFCLRFFPDVTKSTVTRLPT